jgi:hypothetical protein
VAGLVNAGMLGARARDRTQDSEMLVVGECLTLKM